MFCTQCGHQNSPDSRFCGHCGATIAPGPGSGAGPDADAVTTTSTLALQALDSALEAAELDAGTDTGESGAGTSGVLESLPPASALLVVKRGPNAGSRFLLDADSTNAGRHPDSDIFLDDVTVSRRHAEFVRTDEGFQVRDAGSLNGTYLNRERIEQAVLSGGDEVQIGKYRLVFLTGPRAGDGA